MTALMYYGEKSTRTSSVRDSSDVGSVGQVLRCWSCGSFRKSTGMEARWKGEVSDTGKAAEVHCTGKCTHK